MEKFIVLIMIIFCWHLSGAQVDSVEVPAEEEIYYDTETIDDNTESTDTEEDDSGVAHMLVEPDQLPSTQEYQKEKVYHRNFDDNKWRETVGTEDYIESKDEEENKSEDGMMRMPSMAWGGDLLKAIGYTVIIAVVIFLLYVVYRNIDLSKKKFRNTETLNRFATQNIEDIRELDIEALLKEALASRNFKVVVRLYYLSLLKNLNSAGHIKWEKDKTNRDYLTELFTKDAYYDEVKKLTRGYEEVWYGEHIVPEETLLQLIAKFETINNKINLPKSL